MVKSLVGASAPTGIDWKDYLKKLLVIEPLEVEKDIKTVHGVSDAVRANVYVVKSADGSEFEAMEDILIFPRVLQGQTRRKIGSIVAGRLTQGEAKRGQDPPWVLGEPSEKDLKAASALVAVLNTSGASGGNAGADDFDDAPAGDDEGEF
jgi:hypothetical protein